MKKILQKGKFFKNIINKNQNSFKFEVEKKKKLKLF